MKENGKLSMMRVSLVVVIAAAVLCIVTLNVYIIAALFMSAVIEWSGVAMFLGAVGAFIAPALGFKAVQKKHENKY
jgi:predicted phage tail protein